MTETKTIPLEEQIKKLAFDEGAVLVGICEASALVDKEFSDPNFLLPGAQSIISVALKQDEESIRKYLAKEERDPFCLKSDFLNKKLYEIGDKIKHLLEERGAKTHNCKINFDYRNANMNETTQNLLKTLVNLVNKEKDENQQLSRGEEKQLNSMKKMLKAGLKRNKIDFVPEFSHRCAAEAAGLGRIGWSGNLITKDYGARVMLTSVITDVKLKPDEPLKENPCLMCKLCEKVCQGGFFSRDEEQAIKIAGVEEKIGKRNSYSYCAAVCGGMIGQNRFKEWSTWSPYRFETYGLENVNELPLDETIDDFYQDLMGRVFLEGGRKAAHLLMINNTIVKGLHNKPKEDYIPTCACCQIICGPTMKDKKESYKLLINSGCIDKGEL